MSSDGENTDKLEYLLTLLGRKRSSITKEVLTDHFDHLQFDLMAKMTENCTDLENECLSNTIDEQRVTEQSVKEIYEDILETGELPHLNRSNHVNNFLKPALSKLPASFQALFASQPWLPYWIGNALNLLGEDLPAETKSDASKHILSFVDETNGGIGGGMGQLGHLAATYSAILSLASFNDEDSIRQLNTELIYKWLMGLKQDDGSFVMHANGEKDTRAVYCALVIASLLNVLTPELTEGVAEWLGKCQSYEGGFGGTPYDEAHGGYTFCGVSALFLLGKDVLLRSIDYNKLISWVAHQQKALEGGFCGRSNKLVDGCYSFWVGGLMAIFDIISEDEVCSRAALQNYILSCCQFPKGGLIDKPGKPPDGYHTNYVLSGLSILQNKFYINNDKLQAIQGVDRWAYAIESRPVSKTIVEVNPGDVLQRMNPVFALPLGVAERFHALWLD